MKNYFLPLFAIAVLAIATTSCEKCKDITCQNGSTCDKGQCICPTGYSGDNCEIKDPCLGVNCLNGGTCASGTCNCATGYSGTNCETKDPCLGVTCLNGGTCSNGTCDCPTGYYGADCSGYCASCTTFTGNYYCFRKDCGQTNKYYLTITTTGNNKISISNFNNNGWNVTCDISGNSFTIPLHTFTLNGNSTTVQSTAACTLNTVQNPDELTLPVKINFCNDNVLLFKQ